MKIDLLYFDGCPAWQSGLENLKAALAAEGQAASIHRLGRSRRSSVPR